MMDISKLKRAILLFVHKPMYPMYNFDIARIYESLGQTAPAISFYLRCAEFTNYDLLSYECLLRISICMNKQGNRVHTLKGLMFRAISLMPERPEGYLILSRLYESCNDWNESYAFAIIGEKYVGNDDIKLMTDVGYYGGYTLKYQRAVSGWNIGLFDESLYLFRQLIEERNMAHGYMRSIKEKLDVYGQTWIKDIKYDKEYHDELKYKFNESYLINENYSHVYQDMFVLTMLNGKRNGKYVEIGSGDPWIGNNTALLETVFNWSGISIDKNSEINVKFNSQRKNKVITADAVEVDYNNLLTDNEYDYLQIDCDPAIISFNVLRKIPFDKKKFAVITFEHDYFHDENKEIKSLSRKYLQSYGYKLVVDDISKDRYSDFEDWWIHPDLIDKTIFDIMYYVNGKTKKADFYMLNRM